MQLMAEWVGRDRIVLRRMQNPIKLKMLGRYFRKIDSLSILQSMIFKILLISMCRLIDTTILMEMIPK